MKTKTAFLVLMSVVLVTVSAKSPVRYMTRSSLGVEYIVMWRGQDITEADVPSHEQSHLFALNYSPIEYVQFLFGIGMDRFEVDEHNHVQFLGNYGVTVSAGAYLNSPAFKVNDRDLLRFTGGVDFLYLNSEDDEDYKYSGPIIDPHVGLLVHAGPYLDIEAGAKGHFIYGIMDDPVLNLSDKFSNKNLIRGYFTMALTSISGAFTRLNFDISPATSSKWKSGPAEASIGLSVGFLLKTERVAEKEKSGYFPHYQELKKIQQKMADEIAEEVVE